MTHWWVTSETNKQLLIVRIATGDIVKAIAAQPEAINVTPDGRDVWVGSNATGLLSVVDVGTGTVSTAAENFGWPYRVLFSPDNTVVLLPDLKKEELRFVDRRTRRHRRHLPHHRAADRRR